MSGLAETEKDHTVTEEHSHNHIRIAEGESSVSGEILTTVDRDGIAHVVVHAQSGHVVPGLRRGLIDALLNSAEARDSERLAATIPLGDVESLMELNDRCAEVTVHAAGSTALVEARLPDNASQPLGFPTMTRQTTNLQAVSE
jgi:hypothetical protein